MTKLNCCVGSCAYNEENCCCLGEIQVEGGEPQVPSTTECKSFIEKGEVNNHITAPSTQLEIKCNAVACRHNKSCKCSAEEVFIVGQGASQSDETQCNTFCK